MHPYETGTAAQVLLGLTPRGAAACELACADSGVSHWLAQRGVLATAVCEDAFTAERLRHTENIRGGAVEFAVAWADAFEDTGKRFAVLHHHGFIHRHALRPLRAILARHVCAAPFVLFTVPSARSQSEPGPGERMLTLEDWAFVLAPFRVLQLRYESEGSDQILCVLEGKRRDSKMRDVIAAGDKPWPLGISAIVHTRNEESRLADCLETLKGWTDEIIVCDMESDDRTVEIALEHGARIVRHPRVPHFDRARNAAAMYAQFEWVFYLDADERVPPDLRTRLRSVIDHGDATFNAAVPPFRHHFSGHWMMCLYPGYTAPRLFRNGSFFFRPRLHSGPEVQGETVYVPAENPDLAIVHYSYDSIHHYLAKVNDYTDGEALTMDQDGRTSHWQYAVRHFVDDFRLYYEGMNARQDGPHGFTYSFLSAFYRFAQHAKLFERRASSGRLLPQEQDMPESTEAMLEFALRVCRERPVPSPQPLRVGQGGPESAEVVWSGPFADPSGYGDEARNLLFATEDAGLRTAGHVIPWSNDQAPLTDSESNRLRKLCGQLPAPGFVHITDNFAPAFRRHPEAGICIGRTMFETDRLPPDWVKACNLMDYIWVPSEFNRATFADAGVKSEKLVVVPECFDAEVYLTAEPNPNLVNQYSKPDRYTFLSVFDWTLHKGWDVLLRAFLQEFEGCSDVRLILKVWSTMAYGADGVRRQAEEFVRADMGVELVNDSRVEFLQQWLAPDEFRALYAAGDCFVLPSRGEGWGRPYMEAMAAGKPTIGTGWSGNTAFMNHENSILLGHDLVPVPEQGWREVRTYAGHKWAEPSLSDLRAALRRVYEDRTWAQELATRGREDVLQKFSRASLGKMVLRELARARETPPAVAPSPSPVEVSPGHAAVRKRKPSPGAVTRVKTAAVWEGAIFAWHSLGRVNREICTRLLRDGVELSLQPIGYQDFNPAQEPQFSDLGAAVYAQLRRPPTAHVRHFFPPRFAPPNAGRLVLMQPWEYGYIPRDWVEPIRSGVAEVWCNSEYVRRVYRDSGIPEERLQLVPLGVDADVFRRGAPEFVAAGQPGAERARGHEGSQFVFLFLGGTLHRKGIDILIAAYKAAFSAIDDVCLIIKDTCTQTVYKGQNAREEILALAADPSRPPVLYIEDELTANELAGIYSAADCLVQPYRGEGFCLPVLEAMACGIPVMVPEGGPTDDFVDESVGWRLAAAHVPFGNGRIGDWECAGPTWQFEVSIDLLARAMRNAFANPADAARRGIAGSVRAESWTWDRTAAVVEERLDALAETARPKTVVQLPPRKSVARSAKSAAGRRKRPTVSLCMIVRNEERVLPDCLKSVQPWVDEIVIVDTGSEDSTRAIAARYGARQFEIAWPDSFSEARNESINHATGDWIFWMDADDTLPEDSGRQIRDLAYYAEDATMAYIMPVRVPAPHGEFGETVVDHVKLFRNLPELRFDGRIHEQILGAVQRQGGNVVRSSAHVVHSGYDRTPEGQLHKRKRDLPLLMLDIQDKPTCPFRWFNLGMSRFHWQAFTDAVEALERSIKHSQPRETLLRKSYAMLAASCEGLQKHAEAKKAVEAGLAIFPSDPELLFRAGNVYRNGGDPRRAIECYTKLLTVPDEGHFDSLDISMRGYKAHHNIALAYQDIGDNAGAERSFRTAVEERPDFTPSWLGLVDLLVRLGRRAEVLEMAQRIQQAEPSVAAAIRERLG